MRKVRGFDVKCYISDGCVIFTYDEIIAQDSCGSSGPASCKDKEGVFHVVVVVISTTQNHFMTGFERIMTGILMNALCRSSSWYL